MKPNNGIAVLGVDPGLNNLGYGLVYEYENSLKPGLYGQCVVPTRIPFDEKLIYIGRKFTSIIDESKPDFIAIEKIYVAKNTQIALSIGVVSGVIAYSGIVKGIKVYFVTPGEIKKTITGGGQAMKHQVCYMVQKLLGLQEDPGEHAVDALATAISFISINKFHKVIGEL
ncbi:MAG: crossover junction endodeoxyribonuclease RuvC [bacterium]|nr:crossover junction endodeoxyribonuclease RuvC [bacterium]